MRVGAAGTEELGRAALAEQRRPVTARRAAGPAARVEASTTPNGEEWGRMAPGVVLGMVLALCLSFVVRGITAELGQSVGRTWPFSMEHCRSLATPGCRAGQEVPGASR